MLFAPIIVAVLLGQARIPFSKQVCPNPTGANGYEEYLYAADIVDSTVFRSFSTWELYWEAKRNGRSWGGDEGGVSIPIPPTPPRLSLDSTLLDIRRVKAKQFERIFELIRAGNRKSVSDPRKVFDYETLLPELAPFKNLTKFIAASAYVSYADGKSAEGTRKLLDGLEFSRKFNDGPLINELVSIACHAILLAQFEAVLPQLSEADARQVIDFAKAHLALAPSYTKTLMKERQSIALGIDAFFKSPEIYAEAYGIVEEGNDGFVQAIRSLSPAKREELRLASLTKMFAHFDRLIAQAAGPETGWIKPVPEPEWVDPSKITDWTPDNIVEAITGTFMPLFGQAISSVARTRTQLRLLMLHARVIDYRWQNGALPKKLMDAVPTAELIDPFSGEEFKYELVGHTGYRLYSKGFGTTGEIELRYRRPKGIDSPMIDDGEMPPPYLRSK